jgi:hypothetical protein
MNYFLALMPAPLEVVEPEDRQRPFDVKAI